MDTKDLIKIKKERLREELEKLVPPGFFLQPPPKNRGEIYDNLDEFLNIDQDLSMRVGYLVASNKGYNTAIEHLRFFGFHIDQYQSVKNTGSFFNAPQLNKDLEEAANYIIRFYELAKITVKRIDEEVDNQLKVIQNQRDKQKAEQQKQKATKFVSGATSFRPGSTINVRVSRGPGIIPKRTAPQQVLETISKKTADIDVDDSKISSSKKLVTDLGRVTLQIEQTNNNLNRVVEIIAEDIKNTKDQNRREVDEYRRRVANRGRTLGRRELGSSKVDVAGVVKKYVGSFFSGTGGSIRALASFNLLQKLLEGDFVGALGPLLGIGLTYLPQVGALVAGLIGKKILKGVFSGKGGRTPTAPSRTRITGDVPKIPKLGKFGKIGLGLGALSLGSALLGRGGSEEQTNTQQRLEDLTQQQKQSLEPEKLSPIPQSELKRFENLNRKFEEAIDFLLKKQKEQETQKRDRPGGGGGSGGAGNPQSLSLISGDIPNEMKSFMDLIATPESGGNYEAMYPGTTLPGATDMTIAEVARRATGPVGKYQQKPQFLEERARAVGLDPNKDKFSPENQDKITRGHITNLLGGDESKVVENLRRDPSSIKKRLEETQFTGLQKYGSDFNKLFEKRMKQYESAPIPRPLPAPQVQRQPEKQLKPDNKEKELSLLPLGLPPATPSIPASSAIATNPTTSVSTGGGVTELLAMNCKLSSGCVG
jgi:hypothetical protein